MAMKSMVMSSQNKPIIIWLFTGAILVFIMTAIGGITRLTESGLSMVDWHLFMGAIPPLTEEAWRQLFEQYQQFPEFQTTHRYFQLEDFKRIFFWEYTHRLLGRLIGLVFIIPFVIFIAQRRLSKSLLKKLTFLLIVGGFQGFLGWYMVSSGLIKEPRVSHFRLAAHLSTAFFTIAYSVWLALGLIQEKAIRNEFPQKLYKWTIGGLVLLAIQIIFGAFVAGKDAGFIHNYWPNMAPGELISPAIYAMDSFWDNIINNPSGIQFMHRNIAYIVVSIVFIIWVKVINSNIEQELKKRYHILLTLVFLQFMLGIITLLYHVPVYLGVLHQLGALLLLLGFIYVLSWHRVKEASTSTETN